ncbi:MAG: hypothetical protein PSX36_16080 [bacterium]|nr:hypothetical protein [bacterium]
MKKYASLLIILVLTALVGISLYLAFGRSRTSTVDAASRSFGYKDTAAITKIFLADKDHHTATLVRTKDGWMVNEKHHCRPDAILNLLEVIKLVEVKMPVPKEAKENVLKFMSFNAVKVEIYAGDDKVKQYYVGHETDDSEGSYMLLSDPENGENYKEPYACFIPGFKGFLQPRYIADENDWRDRLVLNYIPPQIKEIKVEHVGAAPDSSFIIELQNANTFKLKNLKGVELAFDDARLRQYLVYYQNISYEVLLTGKSKTLQDSLARVKPFTVITVTNTDATSEEYAFYRKQPRSDIQQEHGVTYDFDPDHLYLRFDKGREWALAQYYVFGKLFVTNSYFRPLGSVKK